MESLLSIVLVKRRNSICLPALFALLPHRLLNKVRIKMAKMGIRLDGKAISWWDRKGTAF